MVMYITTERDKETEDFLIALLGNSWMKVGTENCLVFWLSDKTWFTSANSDSVDNEGISTTNAMFRYIVEMAVLGFEINEDFINSIALET